MINHTSEQPPAPRATLAVDGRTRVIVHLAYPSTHLRTPSVFNPRARERGFNAILVPWQVAPDQLATAWAGLRVAESLAGVIVTVPHKGSVAALCDELEGDARLLNVANVARRTADGRFIGRMLDGDAYVAGLRGQGIEPRGRRILMVGAGGAATAMAYAFAGAGAAALVIANRSADKAQALAALVASAYPGVPVTAGPADPSGFDLVINATSLGLKPDDPLPVDVTRIAPGTLVGDVVMQPKVTPLLEAAQVRGARIHLGEHMIHAQIDALIDLLLGD